MPNPKLIKDEDFIEDCRQAGKEEAAERGTLPYYLRRRPAPALVPCKACGRELDWCGLTEDGLCPDCDGAVREAEAGKVCSPAPLKKAAVCSQCKLICWQDELIGDICAVCFKEHYGEVKGDDVG